MTSLDPIIIFPETEDDVHENSKGSVQDSQRETDLANLFGLTLGVSRIDVDAWDEFSNPYELKSSSKGAVSTARDFGPEHIRKYGSRYWLISAGRNTKKKGFVTETIWFLAPCLIKPWLDAMQRDFDRDTALAAKLMEQVPDGVFTDEEAKRLRYMLHRGMLKNDPNIPKSYLETYGIEIKENHHTRLRDLIREWPLDRVLDPAPVWYRKNESDELAGVEYFVFNHE